MKKPCCFLFLLCVFGISVGYGQTSAPAPVNYLPPSPAATQMLRFGEYPVSLFTGLVDISVPIHTIEVNGITVPISLKYHASGIKYDDVSTGVGLGWMLDAGGMATYQTNGIGAFDEDINIHNTQVFIKETNEIKSNIIGMSDVLGNPTPVGSDYIDELIELSKRRSPSNNQYPDPGGPPTLDGEVDIITYSFPGHQGKAGYRKDTELFFFNDDPLRLSYGVDGIDIKDDNGIHYGFHTRESQTYSDYLSQLDTYHLSQITSADKKDIVEFVYLRSLSISKPSITDQATVVKHTETNQTNVRPPSYDLTWNFARATLIPYNFTPLSKIKFRGGEIQFQYSTTAPIWLQNITVVLNGTVVKTISLEKGNFGNGLERLDKVVFKNANGVVNYDYEFEYEDLPVQYNVPYRNASVDYWGYYNGGSNGQYVPTFHWGHGQSVGMSREPSESNMKKGMLIKIHYPTGGHSKFTYETHKSYGLMYGGLRIKQIDHYDKDDSFLYRNKYEYGTGEAISAIPNSNHYYLSQSFYMSGGGAVHWNYGQIQHYRFDVYSAFANNLRFSHGSPVVYPQVIEYREGGIDGENGKTIHEYTYHYPDSSDRYNSTNRAFFAPQPLHSYDYKNGKLKAKRVFNQRDNEIYSLQNTYEEKNERKYNNLHVDKKLSLSPLAGAGIDDLRTFARYYLSLGLLIDMYGSTDPIPPIIGEGIPFQFSPNDMFEYYNYFYICGRYVLTKSVEKKDGVAVTTTYTYPTYPDDSHPYLGRNYFGVYGQTDSVKVSPFPSKMTTTSTDGQKIVTEYKYPYDFPWNDSLYGYSPSTGPTHGYGMVANNIIAPVIEKKEFNGSGTQLSLLRTNYSRNGDRYAPLSVETLGETTPRIEYKQRDSYGNPQWIVQDGLDIVYIWDNDGLYPEIEVKGATYAQVESALTAARNRPSGTYENAVRNYFKNNNIAALVSWYTYIPGVGISSVTDPSGRTTYYDYDSQNRLSTVRNTEGHVVEQYKYNYQQ